MNPLNNFFELATLIFTMAVLTLILNPRSNTVPVIGAATSGMNSILNTITLQNGGGYSPAGYR